MRGGNGNENDNHNFASGGFAALAQDWVVGLVEHAQHNDWNMLGWVGGTCSAGLV